jgi:hypothetical protein
MSKGVGEDKDNHRAKFKMLAAGCKEDKKSSEARADSIVPELPDIEVTDNLPKRKTSRECRADQLKILEERIKRQETESDCFERTFGRHLNKLRCDVTTLSKHTDDYLADTRYKTFQIDQFKRRY